MRDVQKVLVIEVFRNAILLPRAATHRQGKFETAIEAPAVSERVREINKHPHNRQIFRQFSRACEIRRVKTHGMTTALKV